MSIALHLKQLLKLVQQRVKIEFISRIPGQIIFQLLSSIVEAEKV